MINPKHKQNSRITGKEIHLRHRAPVLGISVIDRNAAPLPSSQEVQGERAKPPDMTGAHQVVIVSEEQFKVSSAHGKSKLGQKRSVSVCVSWWYPHTLKENFFPLDFRTAKPEATRQVQADRARGHQGAQGRFRQLPESRGRELL